MCYGGSHIVEIMWDDICYIHINSLISLPQKGVFVNDFTYISKKSSLCKKIDITKQTG